MVRCYDNNVIRFDYEFVTYDNKTVEIFEKEIPFVGKVETKVLL